MSHAVRRDTSGRYVVETSSLRPDEDTVFCFARDAEREAALLNARDDAHENFTLFDEDEHLS